MSWTVSNKGILVGKISRQKRNYINTSVRTQLPHPGSRGVADIVSVTMPLLSIKDLAVAISTRVGPAENDPLLYKLGSKLVQAV